jgi:hypothetical protein
MRAFDEWGRIGRSLQKLPNDLLRVYSRGDSLAFKG